MDKATGKVNRPKVQSFEDLYVWQKAVEFAKDIYLLTERDGIKTDFGLRNQMRNAVVSISTNIAEGFERRSRKEPFDKKRKAFGLPLSLPSCLQLIVNFL